MRIKRSLLKTTVSVQVGHLPPPCDIFQEVAHPVRWGMSGRQSCAGWQLVFVTSGSAELQTDRFDFVDAGQLVLVPPGLACGWKNTGPQPLGLVKVQLASDLAGYATLDRLLHAVAGHPPAAVMCRYDRNTLAGLSAVAQELDAAEYGYKLNLTALLLTTMVGVLRSVLKDLAVERPAVANIVLLEKALAFMEANCAQDLSLKDICSLLRLGHQQTCRLFRSQLSTSPMRHLFKVRMEKAGMLLADPFIKIKEVAGLVGIRNARHFRLTFKRVYGRAPQHYRASLLGKTI
jgi:AraC-like DNA-binding protein